MNRPHSHSSSADHRAEIVARLAVAREELSRELGNLSDRMNVSRRLQTSFQEHPAWWIGGGIAAGWILSRLLGRNSGSKTTSANSLSKTLVLGLMGTAAKEIISGIAPTLKDFALSEFQRWSNQRPSSDVPESPDAPHG